MVYWGLGLLKIVLIQISAGLKMAGRFHKNCGYVGVARSTEAVAHTVITCVSQYLVGGLYKHNGNSYLA